MFKKFCYGLMFTSMAMTLVYGQAYAQAMSVHSGHGPGHIHDDDHEHTDEELEEAIRLDREGLEVVQESVTIPHSVEQPEEDDAEPQNNVRMRYNGDQSIMDGVEQPPRVFNNVR